MELTDTAVGINQSISSRSLHYVILLLLIIIIIIIMIIIEGIYVALSVTQSALQLNYTHINKIERHE